MSLKCRVDVDTEIDIEKCPHILIGGSTGSGKSYLIKSMVCDLLRSDEAMVMVLDPKSVDYQFLENNKNLEWDANGKESEEIKDLWLERGLWLGDRDSIDSMEALSELKELVREMYKRYNIMRQLGYTDWSEILRDNVKYVGPFGSKRVVLVIDELADLIYWDRQKNMDRLIGYAIGEELELQEKRDIGGGRYEVDKLKLPIYEGVWEEISKSKGGIEECLVRLSILGRASGIHLLLGTQRPDASVLSGQLRANLPTRICLRVSNKMERRIILGDGGNGSEREMKYLSQDYKLKWELR